MSQNPESRENFNENIKKTFSGKFAKGSQERKDATRKIFQRVKEAEQIQKEKDRQRMIAYEVQSATVGNKSVEINQKNKDTSVLNEAEYLIYQDAIATAIEDEAMSESTENGRDIMEIIFQSPVFQAHYPQWYLEYNAKSSLDFRQKYPNLNAYILEKGKKFIQARQNNLTEARIKKLPLDPTLSLSDKEKEQQKIVEAAIRFIAEHQADLVAYASSDNKEDQKNLYFDFLDTLNIGQIDDKDLKALFEAIAEDTVAAYTAQLKFEAIHEEMVNSIHNAQDYQTSIKDDEWDAMIKSAMIHNAQDLLREAIAGEIIYRCPYKTWNGKTIYYEIFRDMEDDKNLEIWKKDVDSVIEETHKELSLPYEERSKEIQKALGKLPTNKDIILYSIGLFLYRKRTKNFHHLSVRAEIVSGQPQRLTTIGE